MPKYRTEQDVVVGNMEWLGSNHGIRNARTEILDISTFTAATHYPNGYIPSGMPVAKVGGVHRAGLYHSQLESLMGQFRVMPGTLELRSGAGARVRVGHNA